MEKKSKFHHGNLKIALLEAALEILDEQGPEAMTIRQIARRIGVSHAAPVNHFKNRQALMTEVAVVLFEALEKEIRESMAQFKGNLESRIQTFADELIAFGLKHPNRYNMLWRRDLVDNQDPRLMEAMDGIYNLLMEELDRNSLEIPFDNHTIAIGLWSIAHGYVSMRLTGNFESAVDEKTGIQRQKAIIDTFTQGLFAP